MLAKTLWCVSVETRGYPGGGWASETLGGVACLAVRERAASGDAKSRGSRPLGGETLGGASSDLASERTARGRREGAPGEMSWDRAVEIVYSLAADGVVSRPLVAGASRGGWVPRRPRRASVASTQGPSSAWRGIILRCTSGKGIAEPLLVVVSLSWRMVAWRRRTPRPPFLSEFPQGTGVAGGHLIARANHALAYWGSPPPWKYRDRCLVETPSNTDPLCVARYQWAYLRPW